MALPGFYFLSGMLVPFTFHRDDDPTEPTNSIGLYSDQRVEACPPFQEGCIGIDQLKRHHFFMDL